MKPTLSKIKSALIILVALAYQSAVMAQETLYPFSDKGKYGYINKTGKVVLLCPCCLAYLFLRDSTAQSSAFPPPLPHPLPPYPPPHTPPYPSITV